MSGYTPVRFTAFQPVSGAEPWEENERRFRATVATGFNRVDTNFRVAEQSAKAQMDALLALLVTKGVITQGEADTIAAISQ